MEPPEHSTPGDAGDPRQWHEGICASCRAQTKVRTFPELATGSLCGDCYFSHGHAQQSQGRAPAHQDQHSKGEWHKGLCRSCGIEKMVRDGMCNDCYYRGSSRRSLREIGRSQSLLLWAVLASVAGHIGLFVDAIPRLLVFVYCVPAIAFMLFCVYKAARAIGCGVIVSVLSQILMFFPMVSLIVLLILNREATSVLRNAGVKVGLMGAKQSDLRYRN